MATVKPTPAPSSVTDNSSVVDALMAVLVPRIRTLVESEVAKRSGKRTGLRVRILDALKVNGGRMHKQLMQRTIGRDTAAFRAVLSDLITDGKVFEAHVENGRGAPTKYIVLR